MKKLSFTIDNAELINENADSKFSLLSLDFFASGKNRHNTFVSDETLLKNADTIKNCPVVWMYDPVFDDAYTHDKNEVPCGFIPESAEIKQRVLEDGRIMLSVISYVWKKFSGKILDFFKRDGDKPVSVEMSVYETQDMSDGLLELMDYRFEAVTVLGNYVTPAIPMAKATVLQFAKEYEEDYFLEFSGKFDELDFKIPKKVKENAQNGLDLYAKHKRGGTSVSLSVARFLTKNETANPEKIEHISKHMLLHSGDDFSDKAGKAWIGWQLRGGNESLGWSKKLVESMTKIKERKLSYFSEEGGEMPYKKISDANPAIRGIDPPVSLSQANAISKQADAIGQSDKVNGWAVAIAAFKRSHKIVEGKWVEKLKEEKMSDEEKLAEEVKMAEEKKKLEMAAQTETDEKKKLEDAKFAEDEAKKKAEEEEAKKKEEMAVEEKPFSFAEFSNLIAYMDEEVGDDEPAKMCKLAAEELKKPEGTSFGAVAMGMYAKMCKMAAKVAEMSVEMSALKEFKASIEAQQKQFAVDQTLRELEEKVVIPEDARAAMIADAEKYSFAEINIWQNNCKAKSFDFAVKIKESGKPEIKRYAMPFTNLPKPENNGSVWPAKK